MAQIGLTATNPETDSNAGMRTAPSPPQPPAVLPGVSGGGRSSGTMARNEGPNGELANGASSASRDGEANVEGTSNGAIRNGLPVVRPEVPECYPEHSPSFFPKQEWAGRVTAIDNGSFDARLRDLTGGGREVATIDLKELSLEDRDRIRIGSLFHWVMGYETVNGTRSNVSRVVFLDPPRLTRRDLERGRRWAEWLHDRWGSE